MTDDTVEFLKSLVAELQALTIDQQVELGRLRAEDPRYELTDLGRRALAETWLFDHD